MGLCAKVKYLNRVYMKNGQCYINLALSIFMSYTIGRLSKVIKKNKTNQHKVKKYIIVIVFLNIIKNNYSKIANM